MEYSTENQEDYLRVPAIEELDIKLRLALPGLEERLSNLEEVPKAIPKLLRTQITI